MHTDSIFSVLFDLLRLSSFETSNCVAEDKEEEIATGVLGADVLALVILFDKGGSVGGVSLFVLLVVQPTEFGAHSSLFVLPSPPILFLGLSGLDTLAKLLFSLLSLSLAGLPPLLLLKIFFLSILSKEKTTGDVDLHAFMLSILSLTDGKRWACSQPDKDGIVD